MRKAQTEIIGLMVIVILFIFIGMIYIMFAGKPSEESLTRDVTRTGKVQNMLDAFTQITPCYTKMPYEQMSTIIKNCYVSNGEETVCGKGCKDLIEKVMEELMASYDDKQEYEFKIANLKGVEFLSMGQCQNAVTTPTATERVVAGEPIILRLTYCIK